MMLNTLKRFLFGTLRGRLIISVALVHAVMMTLFIGELTIRQRAMLLDRQAEEATALSQTLATSAAGWIAANDLSGLQEIVEAQRRYPELIFAILTDEEGRVLADTDTSRRGQFILDLPREVRQSVLSRTAALVDVATPAIIGGRHVGWVRVGISQKVSGEKLAQIIRSGFVYALAAIVIGSFVAWLMGRRITRRLYAVQTTINSIRAGNRLARATITGVDEAAMMAHEFNSMLDAVAERDAELRASEEKYRELIHKIQAAVVVHGADTRILTSNQMAQRLFGLTEEQMKGKSSIDSDWHFSREDGTVMPLEEYPSNRVMATREPLREAVVGLHHPGMEDDVWVLVSADPVLDEHGDMMQVIVTFVDITEHKKMEEALRRSQEELELRVKERTAELSDSNRQLTLEIDERKQAEQKIERLRIEKELLLNSAGEGIYGLDLEGNHTFVNPVAAGMLGYSIEELLGKHSHTMFHHTKADGSPYLEDECPIYKTFKESSVHYASDEVFWRKDHSSFPVAYTSTPIKEDGKVVGAVVTFRDITERKRAEERLTQAMAELARSNAELEQFAYITSHDLQEPLSMVSSFVQLLEKRYKGRLDGDADDFIMYAVDGVNRMDSLITDLLAYSRVGSRGKEFKPVLSELALNHALSNMQVAIEQSGAVITRDSLPEVIGDDIQLMQLFQNLIGNAIKFCVDRPPCIHVSADQQGNKWVFSVRDNGIGIATEYFGRIFSIFQRLHNRKDYPGTGIGLAICKKVVERYGGRIWVESELGVGSIFYFTIPAQRELIS